jgi:hypothetical protein
MIRRMRFSRSTVSVFIIAAACLLHAAEPDRKWKLLLAIDRECGAINLLLDRSSIKRRSGFLTANKKTLYSKRDTCADERAAHEEISTIAVDCSDQRWAAFTEGFSRDQLGWQNKGANWHNDLLVAAVCDLAARQP